MIGPARSSTGIPGGDSRRDPGGLDGRLASLLLRHGTRISGRDWLADQLSPLAVRRRLATGDHLFRIGDRAGSYYLVERGRMVFCRQPPHGTAAVRFAGEGDLVIYDCDGTHVADARAIGETSVLAIDRRRIESRAKAEPTLRGVLNAVHARELGMILESLGVVHCSIAKPMRERPHMPAAPSAAERISRGRWQPYLAHQSWTA